MIEEYKNIKEAVTFIKEKTSYVPKIGLVLGSGLGEMANEIENKVIIPYEEIPNFPTSTVAGHAGNLVIGEFMNKQVVAMQGRFHYYEGYSMKQVTLPIRVMIELGIEILIVTNAAGGINENYNPGDLMIIRDMINLQGDNPLIGSNMEEFGVRFPDMSSAFDNGLIDILIESGEKLDIELKEGIYTAMTGPNYETPAEIKMLRILGSDAVGMSTIPEVIVAKHSNVNVLGISCISNMAAGILEQPLNHSEVIETTERVKEKFKKLVKEVIKSI